MFSKTSSCSAPLPGVQQRRARKEFWLETAHRATTGGPSSNNRKSKKPQSREKDIIQQLDTISKAVHEQPRLDPRDLELINDAMLDPLLPRLKSMQTLLKSIESRHSDLEKLSSKRVRSESLARKRIRRIFLARLVARSLAKCTSMYS